MAKGLRGIAPLCDIAYLDPLTFLLGLKAEIRRNPANLTVVRTLIWFSTRFELDGEAEAAFKLLAKHWPDHSEAFVERMRYLMVEGQDRHAEFLASHKRHFRPALNLASYELQAQVASGTVDPAQVSKFHALCAETLAKVLHPASPQENSGMDIERLEYTVEKMREASDIAIVGNGPSLRKSGKGPEIDAHSLVIRCNFPTIAEHEDDVGARTDIVFFSETIRANVTRMLERHASFVRAIKLATHTPSPPPSQDGLDDSTLAGIGRLPLPIQQAISALCYNRATTGLVAIVFVAIMVNRPFRLYGFDFFQDTDDAHYFDKQVGAFLGHEIQYERWFVDEVLGAIATRL